MKKADNFDASKWLTENKITTQSNLNEEKPTNDMVKDYWRIMVKNQPEDVINILVGLTNGDLPFEKFSLDTANDVYDSFRDESYDDEINENETLKGFAQNPLSPNMQKQFNMIVSALKKAKTEEEVDKIYYKIVMLPNKVSKIFFDKLVDMGLAEYEGEGISLNFDN
jgi:hypothetical protein